MPDTTVDTTRIFEAALRETGVARLRLDQVVTVYHKTFPAEAMRPDMRQRLRDQLLDMVEAGVLIPEGEGFTDGPLGLPQAVELS